MSLKGLFKRNNVQNIIYVLIAQGFFMLCNLYINHWISKNWNIEGFATFNLIKRIASFVAFPLLIGTGIGIPRYISFLKGQVRNQSVEYLLSGFFIFLSTFLVMMAIVLVFPSIVLNVFEESAGDKDRLVFVILVFILSQGLYVLLNSYYRGRTKFGIMSLLNVLIMSLLPMCMLFFSDNVFTYFLYYSLATLLIVCGVIIYLRSKSDVSIRKIKYKISRLFMYGYPRIVSDLGLFSLEFIPIYLISLFIGLAESGYLAMTFILLKLASMLFELLGSLILPYFGNLFKKETAKLFIAKVNSLLVAGAVFGTMVSIAFYFAIPVAIRSFFPSLQIAIIPSQMVFIVFPVYAVYLLLRNILDVIADKAYNSINLSVAFIVQILILFIGFYFKIPMLYGVLSIVIPYFVLGLLTYGIWLKMRRALANG